jgi:hypothetical protein
MTAGGYLILYNYMIGAFLSVATRDTFWLCLFLFSSGSHLEATHGLVVAFVALCSDRARPVRLRYRIQTEQLLVCVLIGQSGSTCTSSSGLSAGGL